MRMLSEHGKRRTADFGIWAVIFALTVIFSVSALKSGSYLRSNDTFYYLSIADNYLNNGVFLDGTTVPDSPVITPQNGIVWLFCIMRMLSLSKYQCILLTMGINFLLLLSCFYPLIKICRSVGLESKHQIFCVLLFFVGSRQIVIWLYVSPINDMFFFAGQLWLIYVILRIAGRYSLSSETTHSLIPLVTACVLLSIFLIHFRLNIIFVPISGIVAALLLRNSKLIVLMIVLFVVMLTSLFSSYLIVDQYDFSPQTSGLTSLVGDFRHQMYILLFRLLPESLFKDLNQSGNLLYLPFYAALPIAFIQGVRKRNFILLLLIFICGMTTAMTLLHGNITERYLWAIATFMYILLLRVNVFRSIGVLFISAVLLNSFLTLNYQAPPAFAWKDISKQSEVRQVDILMISRYPRSTWFFLDIPSVFRDDYTWEQLFEAPAICVIGPQDYIDNHVGAIEMLVADHQYITNVRYIDYGPNQHETLIVCLITLHAAPDPDGPNGTQNKNAYLKSVF